MKINEIKLISAHVPRKTPFVTNLSNQNYVECLFVNVMLDDGTIGYGETDPREHITHETLGKTFLDMSRLARSFVGVDPLSALEKLREVERPATRLGYEIALHDAIAQVRGIPVYKLLGKKCRDYVRYVGFIGADVLDPEKIKKRGLSQKEWGYETIRVKVGLDEKKDVERLYALREAVGDETKIWLDANEAWSTKESVRMMRKLKDVDIMMMEQPVSRYNIEGLAKLKKMFDVPIMADESVHTPADVSNILKEEAADAVNIKLIKTGGYSEMKKAVRMAKNGGLDVYFGGTTCTDILAMYSRHIELISPEISFFSAGRSREMILKPSPTRLRFPEGYIIKREYNPTIGRPYNLPGLSVTLEESRLKGHILEHNTFRA